jgi:hypothetical protein
MKIKDLDETKILNVKLQNGNKFLKYSHKNIQVKIPVEQFTENEITVSINSVRNLPKGVVAKLFPKQIKLIFTVPLSKYGRLSEQDFSLGIDFSQSNNYTNKRLTVELLKKPDYVNLVRMEPSKIEYIIQK